MSDTTADIQALSSDSQSEPPEVERGRGGRFLPGKAPKSPGRPRKGRSIIESTQELAERRWRNVAKAAVARLERDDAVGNRAWSDYRDTYHGLPKQTLVLERGDDPYLDMMQQLAAIAGDNAPIYIEGPQAEGDITHDG